MTGFVLAVCAGLGVHLLVGPRGARVRLGNVPWRRLGEGVAAAAAVAGAFAVVVGPGIAAVVAGAGAATVPDALRRRAESRQRAAGQAAWPQMIEELRILTGTVGRSVPQALLEVGSRSPEVLRPAFVAAQREWALSGDFEAVVRLLKDLLREPTADAACETLLVAHQVGGDLDRRLADLAEDRRRDLLERRAADSAMAGARLARAFVVLVPVGMGLAALGVGDGRAAFATSNGQLLLGVAAGLVAVCWWWAGTLMQVPRERRVLTS